MLNEIKILFNNIKSLRQLITEGVGDGDIVDAINNREYLYIYYKGDKTIERGYRTIRPFVLGTSTAGNKVLRAWQDKGRSDSLRADSPRKRRDHEYHRDVDGKDKPGWRLFIVDNMTSVLQTGKKFVDDDGNVMIPPLYNENDKQMTSIVASISPTKSDKIQVKDLDNIGEPDKTAQSVSKSEFDKQTSRFKQFYNVGAKKRDATARDIEKLYNVAKKVMKKSPDMYIVVINNRGEFRLMNKKQEEKLPPEAVVGKLTNLYDKLVRPTKPAAPEREKFFKDIKNSELSKRKKEETDKTKTFEENIIKNPLEKRTFFR